MTALSLQSNSTVFIDKTQKERKELLAQFMGIGIFDQLYTLASDEIHDVQALLKSFRDNNYDKDLASIKESLSTFRKDSKELTSSKKEMVESKKEADKKIITLTKKLRKVDDTLESLDDLEERRISLNNNLNSTDEKFGKLKTLSEQYKVEETELTEKINIFKENEVDKKFAQFEQYSSDKRNNQIEIDKLKIEVQNKLDKIEKLGNLEYDANCSYCMDNPFTLDAIQTKKRLTEDKKLADKFVKKSDELERTINELSHITKHKSQMDECISSFNLLTSNISKVDSEQKLTQEKKKNLIAQLAIIEDKINLYHTQEKDILFNKELHNSIDVEQNKSDRLEIDIDDVDKKLQTVNGEIKVLETNRRNIMSSIKKVEELEGKYSAYQYYMDAIKRDGIPYELISKALPTIEGAVNDILAQIVDFSMIL